jgi:hypothetical protein
MSDGHLHCAGSSLFLKNLFGIGYVLTAEKGPGFKEAQLQDLIARQVRNIDYDRREHFTFPQQLEAEAGAIHYFAARPMPSPLPQHPLDPDSPRERLIQHPSIGPKVSDVRPLTNVGAEISFQLPLSSSPKFVGLFQELEARQQELAVSSFGLSVTTLEEVRAGMRAPPLACMQHCIWWHAPDTSSRAEDAPRH